tara:strand:+ start:188 stop:646 length:459 start_codon:yes stop_codon:yes gene_type:complete
LWCFLQISRIWLKTLNCFCSSILEIKSFRERERDEVRRRYKKKKKKKEINAHIYDHFFTALLCFFPRSGESQRRRKIEQRHSQQKFFGESFYYVDPGEKIRFYHQESSSYETKEKIFIFLCRGGAVPIDRRRRRRDERRRELEDRHRDILLV